MSKKETGQAVLQWLLQESPTYAFEKHTRVREQTMEKGISGSPRRRPTTSGRSRLELLCSSGRVIWREDPMTPGVYEYKDTQDYTGRLRRP